MAENSNSYSLFRKTYENNIQDMDLRIMDKMGGYDIPIAIGLTHYYNNDPAKALQRVSMLTKYNMPRLFDVIFDNIADPVTPD